MMQRQIISINKGWHFSLGSTITEDYEIVALPHCVALAPANSSGCRNYQGKCCYEKELIIPEKYSDRKLLLEFEGAMGVTQLYLNGTLLKTHTCGYTPLVVDITDAVQYDVPNTLLLILDNSDNEDVPPGKRQEDLDFAYEGGLYRDARLIISHRLHITNALLAQQVAGGGVFVSYSDVSDASAIVHTKVHVQNEMADAASFALLLTLKNKKGEACASASVNAQLCAHSHCHLESDLNVASPMLWSPDAPNLYTLSTEIIFNNSICDNVDTIIGIRDFAMSYEKGLVFNGKPCRLSGANYHQNYPYIGSAVPDSLLRKDAMKLRELGMKSVRSHYPFGTAFTNACNELGIALIVSSPGWQWFKDGIFVQRAYENLRDIVRWQRNLPSVILWEPILNETDMPAWFQQAVHDIVHEEYPYSPCYTASDHGPTDVSYREYDPGMLSPIGEEYGKETNKAKPVLRPHWIREYNDSPDNWTDHNCAWRVPRGFGDYPMLRSVERMLGLDPQCDTNNYINIFNKEHICGYNIWPAIEHNRGYHINPCWGGHLDLFRLPKFSYYFAKSQMDISECGVQLFIANWWTEMSPDDVTVFSNADAVRLYHNDVLVDEQAPQSLSVTHPPFVFKKVHTRFKTRDRSVLKAEALVNGKVVASVTQQSPGVPAALRLNADFMGLPFCADGADIVLITCEIIDAQGNIVPMTGDNHPIIFTLEGEGKIIGDASIGANPVCAQAGIASLLVQSTTTSGAITLKADMLWKQMNNRAAIKPHEITFNSIKDESICSF